MNLKLGEKLLWQYQASHLKFPSPFRALSFSSIWHALHILYFLQRVHLRSTWKSRWWRKDLNSDLALSVGVPCCRDYSRHLCDQDCLCLQATWVDINIELSIAIRSPNNATSIFNAPLCFFKGYQVVMSSIYLLYIYIYRLLGNIYRFVIYAYIYRCCWVTYTIKSQMSSFACWLISCRLLSSVCASVCTSFCASICASFCASMLLITSDLQVRKPPCLARSQSFQSILGLEYLYMISSMMTGAVCDSLSQAKEDNMMSHEGSTNSSESDTVRHARSPQLLKMNLPMFECNSSNKSMTLRFLWITALSVFICLCYVYTWSCVRGLRYFYPADQIFGDASYNTCPSSPRWVW